LRVEERKPAQVDAAKFQRDCAPAAAAKRHRQNESQNQLPKRGRTWEPIDTTAPLHIIQVRNAVTLQTVSRIASKGDLERHKVACGEARFRLDEAYHYAAKAGDLNSTTGEERQ
jgi:hypothetical protein